MTELGSQIVLITGMSGSGKSTTMHALEDAGFFCIDNLPVLLLPKLTELVGLGEPSTLRPFDPGLRPQGSGRRLALTVDVRERQFLKEAPRVLAEARRAGHRIEVLFLDAGDDALIRRFSETRRRHPLAPDGSVSEGIRLERELLSDLRELADQVIDSSTLNVHDLKRLVQARFSGEPANAPSISVMSFGYRYGVPPQADLVLDVRFLPNPYFVPEMKGLTGRDPKVAAYVLERAETAEFMDRVVGLCQFLFPRYQREGKAYLTVALGCTGGKHRSVAIAHELFKRLAVPTTRAQIWDRDIEKE